jgi:hypothetical protein
MHKLVTGFILATALVRGSGSALAVDQTIVGKKLLILNPASGPASNKLVYLSKDAIVVPVPGDVAENPTYSGAQLTVGSVASGESFTIPLPNDKWRLNKARTVYRYKDTTGATCKIVLIKAAKLVKAVCSGPQISYDLGTDQVSVDVVLRTGTAPRRYCAAFNGTTAGCDVVKNGSDDKKYLAMNCTAAPVVCGASPSGAFVDDIGGLF